MFKIIQTNIYSLKIRHYSMCPTVLFRSLEQNIEVEVFVRAGLGV